MLSTKVAAAIAAVVASSGLIFTPLQDQTPGFQVPANGPSIIGIPRSTVPTRDTGPFADPGIAFPGQSAFTVWRTEGNPEQQKISSNIANAIRDLKAAESSSEKRDAESALRDSLAADYDFKMQQYDDHLKKLEDELDAMRDRLSKRRDAKNDMIELRVKVLRAEADDLGWPTGPNRSGTYFRTPQNWSNATVVGPSGFAMPPSYDKRPESELPDNRPSKSGQSK